MDDHSTIEGEGVRKIGDSVLRKEDFRYIQGQGQYSDDLNKPGQLYGVFVRSQIAHGIIKEIKTEVANAESGVVAVLTGKDFEVDGFGHVLLVVVIGDAREDVGASAGSLLFEVGDGRFFTLGNFVGPLLHFIIHRLVVHPPSATLVVFG